MAASVINSEVSFRQLLETAADTTAATLRAFTLSNNLSDLRLKVGPLSREHLYTAYNAPALTGVKKYKMDRSAA